MTTPRDGAKKGPDRSPTHKPLDHQRMMKLGLAVEECADDQPIDCDALEDLALEAGANVSHLFASAAVTTDVEFAREYNTAFTVCGGVCQNWGALDAIEYLVELRRERIDAGQAGFDIIVKSCLDRCEHAPVVVAHSPDGSAHVSPTHQPMHVLRQAIDEAVEALCK